MSNSFEIGKAIGNNISGAFKEHREENAIDDILTKASKSGNADDVGFMIQQIVGRQPSERREMALNILLSKQQKLTDQARIDKILGNGKETSEPFDPFANPPSQNPKTQNLDQTGNTSNQNQMDQVSGQTAQNANVAVKPQNNRQKGFSELTDSQLVALSGEKGYAEPAKQELKRRQEAAKNQTKRDIATESAIDKSYEGQKDFINDTTSSYKGFETEMKPRLLQLQNLNDGSLIGPTAAKFLETVGIPLGSLDNPGSELYNKLSQDLLKGLPETYGNRILKVEVDNFLKTIPQLVNSVDGRRLIASNILKLGEMKEVFYNEMRRQQTELLDENKKFPKDFQQRVFDNVKPQIDKINQQFLKLSNIKAVPKETVPFFDPQGNVSFVPKNPEALKWAEENGGERIW